MKKSNACENSCQHACQLSEQTFDNSQHIYSLAQQKKWAIGETIELERSNQQIKAVVTNITFDWGDGEYPEIAYRDPSNPSQIIQEYLDEDGRLHIQTHNLTQITKLDEALKTIE